VDRRWDEAPAGCLGDKKGRDLPPGERTLGEIEQRALGERGLVDGVERLGQVRVVDEDDQRLVRGPGQAPEDLQVAVTERTDDPGRGSVRGARLS
jgi:hypothetical protein